MVTFADETESRQRASSVEINTPAKFSGREALLNGI